MGGVGAPGRQVFVQPPELHHAGGRLHGREAVVVAQLDMVVPPLALHRALPVVANEAQAGGQLIVVGDDGAALTARGDDLVLPEAEAAHAAQCPHLAPAAERPVGLGGIFDDE